jgi:hypothetical protein
MPHSLAMNVSENENQVLLQILSKEETYTRKYLYLMYSYTQSNKYLVLKK